MARRQNSVPDWAQRVASLRQRHRLSQMELARRLRCSAMTISRWERGMLEPSADYYIQLGNLSGDAECWFFWGRAGLQSSDLMRVMPDTQSKRLRTAAYPNLDIVVAGSGTKKHVPKSTRLVAIPLLRIHAATHGESGDKTLDLDQVHAEDMIAAPSEWCPNPAYTTCLRVKGHSMGPLIHDGYIVAVDYSQTDRSELDGKLVVVWNEDKGLSISRFRRYRGVEVLEPENREYESMALGTDRAWRVIGRVLWWIGKAP
ncbi:MAG: hypothetical protein DMG72_08860 [Acidobacteria bacterium]|nr:MAG: hypothetical protein DMG72_08860 [Acidobacteriota bacterium]